MSENESDRWDSAQAEIGPDAQGPHGAPTSGASSLMSVQIRRTRKRQPCAPAAAPAQANSSAPDRRSDQPAETMPAPPVAGSGGPQAQVAPRPEDITAYWKRLCGNRPYPAASELDGEHITNDWPNSILFRCRAGSNTLEPDKTFGAQAGTPSPSSQEQSGRIELSPMMLQWLLSLAGDAIRNGQPVEDTDAFPAATQVIGYRAIALPLGETGSAIDHVLCHVWQT